MVFHALTKTSDSFGGIVNADGMLEDMRTNSIEVSDFTETVGRLGTIAVDLEFQ